MSVKSPGGGGTPTFWFKSIDGDRMNGSSGSLETGINGLALIIAVTSAISVHKTSWVKRVCVHEAVSLEFFWPLPSDVPKNHPCAKRVAG